MFPVKPDKKEKRARLVLLEPLVPLVSLASLVIQDKRANLVHREDSTRKPLNGLLIKSLWKNCQQWESTPRKHKSGFSY